MPSKRKATRARSSRQANSAREKDRSAVLRELGKSTSNIIQKAASILEEEIAAGLVAAREVERNMREGGDFRSDKFDDIMQRLRKDAHDIVNIISERMDELRGSQSDDLAKRFQKDAHDAVDILLSVVNLAPEMINRLLGSDDQSKIDSRKKSISEDKDIF